MVQTHTQKNNRGTVFQFLFVERQKKTENFDLDKKNYMTTPS
jgi:hypothetical protein